MDTRSLAYKRARFSTELPTDRHYTEGHFWMARDADDAACVRVGMTKFATRMLGEVVEFDFETEVDSTVETGQVVGWLEGFKAVTDLYCPLAGRFRGPNADLEKKIDDIHRRPYGAGWLFRVEGPIPDEALDAEGYAGFLDGTIDRMTGRGA